MLMKRKKIQISLLVMFGLLGLVSGVLEARKMAEPAWWTISSSLLISATIVYWYHVDSTEKKFKRPVWLTAIVIGVTPLGILLYTIMSNKSGLRLRALGRLLGYVFVLFLLSVICDFLSATFA